MFQYLLRAVQTNTIDEVSEYSIAFDVFSKDADFNAAVDSSVRVEMYRLRKNLEQFNAGDNEFEITLPKQSYEFEIALKPKERSRKSFVLPKPSWFAFPLLALIILLGLSRIATKSKQIPLTDTAYPRIHIEIIANNIALNETNIDDARYAWESRVQNTFAEVSTDPAVYDYKIQLSDKLNQRTNQCYYTVRLLARDGTIIDIRQDNCESATDYMTNDKNILRNFETTGPLFGHYVSDAKIDERRRELFACMVGATRLIASAHKKPNDEADLLECLNPDRTQHVNTLVNIYTTRGQLYFEHLRGNMNLKLSDEKAYRLAEENFERARGLYQSPDQDYFYKINLAWTNPDLDKEALRLLVKEAETNRPKTEIILYLSAFSYAFFLDDFESANRILDYEHFQDHE